MANELSYKRINYLIPDIWEAALYFLEYSFGMPGAVTFFGDQTGMAPRDVSEYVEPSITTNLGELQDLTPTLLTRRLKNQIIPKENGVQYLITDRRRETDNENIIADAGKFIGYTMGKQLELDLLTDMQSFSGGLIDKSGAALTWADIYKARARLAGTAVPAPYTLVLSEYQWLDLASAANIAATGIATSSQPVLKIRDDIQSKYYQGSLGDIDIFISGLVPVSSNNAIGGMFNRQAIALDMRRGLRIEPFRDPSLRSMELNASMIYGHGVWRSEFGVMVKSQGTAPGSAVTVNSTLAIAGTSDANSPTNGTNIKFSFMVTNTGAVTATGILVTFTIDTHFTPFVSDSENMGTYDSVAKTWSGFDLAPGQTAVINLTYTGTTGSSKTFVGALTSATPTLSATPSATVTVTVS